MATYITLDGNTAPPSYESISSYPQNPSHSTQAFGRDSSEERRKGCDCSCESSCSIIFIITFIFLFFTVSLSMIVIGGVFYNDCNAEDEIPKMLIVVGCSGCVTGLFFLCCCHGDHKQDTKTAGALLSFNVVCIVLCSVYVYKTHFQSTDSTKGDYCDYYLYWYAFWIVTLAYAAGGVEVLIGAFYIFGRRG